MQANIIYRIYTKHGWAEAEISCTSVLTLKHWKKECNAILGDCTFNMKPWLRISQGDLSANHECGWQVSDSAYSERSGRYGGPFSGICVSQCESGHRCDFQMVSSSAECVWMWMENAIIVLHRVDHVAEPPPTDALHDSLSLIQSAPHLWDRIPPLLLLQLLWEQPEAFRAFTSDSHMMVTCSRLCLWLQ